MDPTMLEEIKQLLMIYGGYKKHTERGTRRRIKHEHTCDDTDSRSRSRSV